MNSSGFDGMFFRRDGSPMTMQEWQETAHGPQKRVAETKVGDAWISTVWLGLDYSFGSGVPLIFETMVFGGEYDGRLLRWATEDSAIRGHEAVVEMVKGQNETSGRTD